MTTTDPPRLDPAEFFDFVGRSRGSVVFLSVHPAHPFNRALARHLEGLDEEPIEIVTMDLSELVVMRSPVLAFLHAGLRRIPDVPPIDVLPGYYLLCEGHVLAWRSGLPARGDAAEILRGSLLGAFMSAVTRRLSYVRRSVLESAEEVAARRMASAFGDALGRFRKNPQPPPPPRSSAASDHDVQWAYRTLGIDPGATDDEVTRAWRDLRREHHPDRAANDPAEFERRNRVSAELNDAREIIREHRSRQQHRAAS